MRFGDAVDTSLRRETLGFGVSRFLYRRLGDMGVLGGSVSLYGELCDTGDSC